MERYRLITTLDLRANPSAASPSLGEFPAGTVVEEIGINGAGSWLQVRIRESDGSAQEGWMSLKYLTKLPNAPFKWQLGINLREFAYYETDANDPNFTPERLRSEQLTACRDNGIRLVRFFASHRDFEVETSIPLIRQALDTLNDFKMQAIVCLDASLNGADPVTPDSDYFQLDADGHWVSTSWRQQAHIANLCQIVSAFSDHPAVYMWELGNESQPGDDFAFYEFVKEASEAVRQIAAPKQFMALGLTASKQVFNPPPERDRFAALRLYQLPSIDAIGIHYNPNNDNDLKSAIKTDCEAINALGKPFYVSELGASNGGHAIDNSRQTDAPGVLLWQHDNSLVNVGVLCSGI